MAWVGAGMGIAGVPQAEQRGWAMSFTVRFGDHASMQSKREATAAMRSSMSIWAAGYGKACCVDASEAVDDSISGYVFGIAEIDQSSSDVGSFQKQVRKELQLTGSKESGRYGLYRTDVGSPRLLPEAEVYQHIVSGTTPGMQRWCSAAVYEPGYCLSHEFCASIQSDRSKSLIGKLNTDGSDQHTSECFNSQCDNTKGPLAFKSLLLMQLIDLITACSRYILYCSSIGLLELPHSACSLISQLTWSTVIDLLLSTGGKLIKSANSLCSVAHQNDPFQSSDGMPNPLCFFAYHMLGQLIKQSLLSWRTVILCPVTYQKCRQMTKQLMLSSVYDPLWSSDVMLILCLVIPVARTLIHLSSICCKICLQTLNIGKEGFNVVLAVILQAVILLLVIILRVIDANLPQIVCVCLTTCTAIMMSHNGQDAVLTVVLAVIPALKLSIVLEDMIPSLHSKMLFKREYVPTTGRAGRVGRGLARFAMGKINSVFTLCLTQYERQVEILNRFSTLAVPLRIGIAIQASIIQMMLKSLISSLRARNWRKTYNWRLLLLIVLCVAGITPSLGMDRTPGSGANPGIYTPGSAAGLSASRLRQLQSATASANYRERARRHRIRNVVHTPEESESHSRNPAEIIQPRALQEIFDSCNNIPNAVLPDHENDRVGTALRMRDMRAYRARNNQRDREAAKQRLMESFNSPQVPSPDDLSLLSESDPDAALLLFHETGGQWRFNSAEAISSMDECPPDMAQALQLETCSPDGMTELINKFQVRLGNTNTIIACGCCGIKCIASTGGEDLTQFPRVSTSDPILNLLQLSPEAEARYQSLGNYSRAVSAWPQSRELGERNRFWLHPELVEQGADGSASVRVCKHCHDCLANRPGGRNGGPKLPELSIANGVDFGNPDRLGLPELTLVEMYLLAPVRLYGSVIKLRPFEKDGDVRILNGHLIAFLQLSANALSAIRSEAIRYPRLDDVRRLITVSFLGDRGQLERMLNGGDCKIPKDLTVRPDIVYQWLDALSVLNPELFPPGSIDIRTEVIETQMRELTQHLLTETINIDAVGQKMNEELESDTARVRFGTQQQADDISDMFGPDSATREGEEGAGAAQPAIAATMLRGNADTLGGSTDTETAEILNAMRNVLSGGDRNTAHRINRDQEPMNEFTDNNRLILGAFPQLFLLGKGLKCTGSVTQRVSQHMILQFHGHFARNRWLLFTLMNQHMRHSAARAVCAAVNAHPESGEEFAQLCSDEEFRRGLEQHSANPETRDAKALAKKCRKFIHMAGAKVPYSPAERNEALSKMYSMTYRYGIPSVFLTISPDDIGSPLVLRWAMNFSNNNSFPATGEQYGEDFSAFFDAVARGEASYATIPIANEHRGSRLKKLVTDNPVAAALVYRQIMEVVLEELLGISPEHKIRKTVPLQSRPKGIFGTTTATFAVTEVQARQSLHGHMAIWGSIPPALLQKAAHNRNIVAKIATVLDSQYTSQFPAPVHVRGMLNRIQKHTKRPSRMPVITPIQLGLDRFKMNTAEKADWVGVHRHTFTCHKGKHGKLGCRVAQPAGLTQETKPVLVKKADGLNLLNQSGPKFWVGDIVDSEDVNSRSRRNRRVFPIPESDARCIVWETMRPKLNAEEEIARLDPEIKASIDRLPESQKEVLKKSLEVRNGAVVSFSPVLTQCLGSNTAAYLLGSEEQARSALYYLVKYMNKDSAALSNSLPVIRQALIHVNRNTSRAEDAGTALRTGKFFMERILNGFTGLAEISDTQSAACLLGMKSYISSEQHWFMWIKGATAYQLESQLRQTGEREPVVAWEDDSDFESHSADEEREEEDILENRDDLQADGAEEQTDRGRGKFGSAQIFRVGDRAVPVAQHVHYRYRGAELSRLNFYEWCAIISIEEIGSSTADAQPVVRRRRKNSTFQFAEGHPLRGTHIQKLRSKIQCPILAGGPPPKYPGPNVGSRSAHWKKKANAYARYMLTAFNPWDINNGSAWNYSQHSTAWDAFCEMCCKLDPVPGTTVATFIDVCRFCVICNVTKALKVNRERKELLTMYRCRAVLPWKGDTPDYACDFENLIHGHDEEGTAENNQTDDIIRRAAREEIDRLVRLNNNVEANHRDKGHDFVASTIACLDTMFPVVERAGERRDGQHSEDIIYQCEGSRISIADVIANINETEDCFEVCSNNPVFQGAGNAVDSVIWDEIEALLQSLNDSIIVQCKTLIDSNRIVEFPNLIPGWTETMQDTVTRSNIIRSNLTAYINERLIQPNAEQRNLLDLLIRSVQRRSTCSAAALPGSDQEHFLVLGGPGVGKTFLVKRLLRQLSSLNTSAVTVAFTGAAAVNIPGGRTIHSLFHLPINCKAGGRLNMLEGAQKQSLLSAIEGKAFLLIDEVSMVSPSLLGMMDERLKQVVGCDLPFGGMSVIALGDFYQLQPCGGSAFFTAIMSLCTGERALGKPDSYEVVGTQLFKMFKLYELNTQMRAREDSEHGAWVDAFRGSGIQPVTRAFITLLKSRLLTPADVVQDPTWAWATVAVTSNMEKRQGEAIIS